MKVNSSWKEKKDHTGFGNNTNNEFSEYLLYRNMYIIFNGPQPML